MRTGVELLEEAPGSGPLVEKTTYYDFSLNIWLSRGDPVRRTDNVWPL